LDIEKECPLEKDRSDEMDSTDYKYGGGGDINVM